MKTYIIGGILIAVIIAFQWNPGSGYQPAVETAGYTNVDMGRIDIFHCPEKEIGYSFTATKDGKEVEGVICRSNMFWGSYQVRTL